MSDPVSNMDVEDVLSSIRRLVSEEAKSDEPLRSIPDERPNGTTADEKLTAPERISLRPPRQPNPRPEPQPLAEPEVAERPTRRTQPFGQPPSNDLEIANEAAPEEQKLVLTAALRVQEEDSLEAALADPAEDVPILRSVNNPESERLLNAEIRKSTTRPKPFQFSSNDTLFDRATKAMDALKENGQADISTGPKTPTLAPLPSDTAPVVETPTIVPDIPQESEPQATSSEVEDNLELADILEKIIEPETEDTAELSAVTEIEEPASTLNFVEEEEPILDEDTLRDMISDMVREELQGELGDRITRNVRKLVRREIQRAMASREFE